MRGRQYPWGTVNIEDRNHCDFTALRSLLLSHHMQVFVVADVAVIVAVVSDVAVVVVVVVVVSDVAIVVVVHVVSDVAVVVVSFVAVFSDVIVSTFILPLLLLLFHGEY